MRKIGTIVFVLFICLCVGFTSTSLAGRRVFSSKIKDLPDGSIAVVCTVKYHDAVISEYYTASIEIRDNSAGITYSSGAMYLPETEDRVQYDQPPSIKAVIFRKDTSIIAKFKLFGVSGTADDDYTCVGALYEGNPEGTPVEVIDGQGTVKFN